MVTVNFLTSNFPCWEKSWTCRNLWSERRPHHSFLRLLPWLETWPPIPSGPYRRHPRIWGTSDESCSTTSAVKTSSHRLTITCKQNDIVYVEPTNMKAAEQAQKTEHVEYDPVFITTITSLVLLTTKKRKRHDKKWVNKRYVGDKTLSGEDSISTPLTSSCTCCPNGTGFVLSVVCSADMHGINMPNFPLSIHGQPPSW